MSGFRALLIEKTDAGFSRSIVERSIDELPPGDLLIEVRYSSLNYKDGLSATGNPGVSRKFPHTPGIDAAGVVVETTSADFALGDEVIAIGFDLGMNTPRWLRPAHPHPRRVGNTTPRGAGAQGVDGHWHRRIHRRTVCAQT